jgi:hypothetical protein
LGICAGVEPFGKLRVNTRQQKCPNGFHEFHRMRGIHRQREAQVAFDAYGEFMKDEL